MTTIGNESRNPPIIGIQSDIERTFQACEEFEKTLTLHSLVQCLSPLQLQFFSIVLQHIQNSTIPLESREEAQRKANDAVFLKTSLNLAEKSTIAEALMFVTKSLALLRPDNRECATIILSFVVDLPTKEQFQMTDNSFSLLKNILAMILAHPAFSDKQKFYVRDSLTVMARGSDVSLRATFPPEREIPSPRTSNTTTTTASGPSPVSHMKPRESNLPPGGPSPGSTPYKVSQMRRHTRSLDVAENVPTASSLLGSSTNVMSSPLAGNSSVVEGDDRSATPSGASYSGMSSPAPSGILSSSIHHSDVYIPPFKQQSRKTAGLTKSRSFEFNRLLSDDHDEEVYYPGTLNSSGPVNNNSGFYMYNSNTTSANSRSSSRSGSANMDRDAFSSFHSSKLYRARSTNNLSALGASRSEPNTPHSIKTMKHSATVSSLDQIYRETQDALTGNEGGSVIAVWLRSLRLHKYTENLQNFDMNTLSGFTEEDLQKNGVAAQGARRKMLLAIKAIHTLTTKIAPVNKEIIQQGKFLDCINVLREVLDSYKSQLFSCGVFSELTSQFTDILFKGFCHLSVSDPNKEYLIAFLRLLRQAITSKCFQKKDMQTFHEWKDELERLLIKYGFSENDDSVGNAGSNSSGSTSSISSSNTPSVNTSNGPASQTVSHQKDSSNANSADHGQDEEGEEIDVNTLLARQRRARRARSNRSKSESSATIPIDVPQGPLSEAQKQEMQQQILDELRKELQELNRKFHTITKEDQKSANENII